MTLPKAARMESIGNGNHKSFRGDVSSSPHIIVECPSCSTRFSVESAAVAAIEDPRFHCSRCDSVFSLENLPASDFTPGAAESTGTVESQNTRETDDRQLTPAPQSFSARPRAALAMSIPTPIKQSDFSLTYDGPSDLAAHDSEESVREVSEATDNSWSHSALASEEKPRMGIGAEDRQIPSLPESFSLLQQATDAHAAQQASAATQALLPFDDLMKNEPTKLSPHSGRESLGDSTSGQDIHASYESNVSRGSDDLSPHHRPPMHLTRSYTLALLSLPLVVGLALLTIFSYSLRLSPQGLGALVSGLMPLFGVQSPKLPPPELAVSKSSIRIVRLQSKEVVPVVSGTLSNRSKSSLDGITLEVLGFDGRGELLISAQAPLRSALAREKISDLPFDTLKKYQTALGARRSAINPGEEVPFSVALIADGTREGKVSLADLDLSQLRYYSARVFSVTETSDR